MRIASAFLLLAAAFVTHGCGYQLGAQGKLPFSTLSILPIQNETLAPQIQAPLHEQLAASLARENAIRLVTETPQATLRVRILRYEKKVAATDPRDTGLGISFTLELTASCDLLNNADPARPFFVNREIIVTAIAHTPGVTSSSGGGFSAVEYQTLPELTRSLSRRIRDIVVGVW